MASHPELSNMRLGFWVKAVVIGFSLAPKELCDSIIYLLNENINNCFKPHSGGDTAASFAAVSFE